MNILKNDDNLNRRSFKIEEDNYIGLDKWMIKQNEVFAIS